MKKIMKAAIIVIISAVLTVGTFGLYNYINEKRS